MACCYQRLGSILKTTVFNITIPVRYRYHTCTVLYLVLQYFKATIYYLSVSSRHLRPIIYRTFLSPSYECPLGRRSAVSVPRRLVPNGDTISLYTTSPLESFYRVPKYGTVPYGASTVPYSTLR